MAHCKVEIWPVDDEFHAFAVKARHKKFSVDNVEINKARWFSVTDLLALKHRQHIPSDIPMRDTIDDIWWVALMWLERYFLDKAERLFVEVIIRYLFNITFFYFVHVCLA